MSEQMKSIPFGFVVVVQDNVREGDLLWTPETQDYEPAMAGEVGTPASSYKRVIRRRES